MGFLIRVLGPSAAKTYFKRLEEAERIVGQLLTLRVTSSEILHLVSSEVQIALEERDHRLEETTSLEARLMQELERAMAESERMSLKKAREQVIGELEALESRQQLVVDTIEEKDRALKAARHTVQDLLLCSEEDIRQEILRRLEFERAEEIRELESWLRDF
ncbi:tropomyosin alpha-1 chain-like [Asparagus officinalis]|uniref:tropomyosin alpha-1 chain-like n=1 Tax=Asparagus officinalis TaxID=4686 RepID=UPI00098E832A|nr:tropomyosin alpha-1 chain-like [Asparagus officinalis]